MGQLFRWNGGPHATRLRPEITTRFIEMWGRDDNRELKLFTALLDASY